MTRKEGERIRLWRALDRMWEQLKSLEYALTMTHPIGTEVAQAITQTATELAMQIAKYDAFDLAEQDGRAEPSAIGEEKTR